MICSCQSRSSKGLPAHVPLVWQRFSIYQSFADAIELAKFKTQQYDGTYLPSGYNAYLFTEDTCYGDRGTEYITHGGMTLEEAVVPFVQIGAYHG